MICDRCSHCGNDLTEALSVIREYVNESESVFSLGHYEGEYFEPDHTADIADGRFDLRDDSDTCSYCGKDI